MCQMILNDNLNGIELYFGDKPDNAIISTLKEVGYRWHKVKKCWYAKQNERTIKRAQELSNGESKSSEPKSKEPDDPYFPSYDSVGSTKIYKSSDIEIRIMMNDNGGYFADEKFYVWFYSDSVSLIDLENALQIGKKCTKYFVSNPNNYNREPIKPYLWNNGLRTYRDLIQTVKSGKVLNDIKVSKTEERSIEVFSPFTKIKPIKTPTKWTKAHLWKAILSGQIYKGVTDSYYTDDYAYDYAYNYHQGCPVDLIKFASDLIGSSSDGIWIRAGEPQDGIIPLSYHNYSFDSKTFYFDESCTFEIGKQRRAKEAKEKEDRNNALLSKVLKLTPSDIIPNSMYKITYLEKDDNTNEYHSKEKLVCSGSIFYEDDDGKLEYRYKIIELKEFIPDDRTIYSISDFYNRPYGDKYEDERIVNMGNWENVVTGYALKELLSEGQAFGNIHISNTCITIEAAKEVCQKHINGTMSWIFGVCDTDYSKSLEKLVAEEARIGGRNNG